MKGHDLLRRSLADRLPASAVIGREIDPQVGRLRDQSAVTAHAERISRETGGQRFDLPPAPGAINRDERGGPFEEVPPDRSEAERIEPGERLRVVSEGGVRTAPCR